MSTPGIYAYNALQSLQSPYAMDLPLLAARVEQINTFVATRAITTKNEILPFAPLNAAADFVDLDRVDFSANAQLSEERRNEIQRDGNNDILVCLPPLCNVALQAQGFHISNLRPTKVEKPYYTSTGAEQEVTDDYRTHLRSFSSYLVLIFFDSTRPYLIISIV